MSGHVSEHLVWQAMNDAENCGQCHGCGKVADTDDRESWLYWLELPPGADLAVRMGIVKPIACPKCGGSGKASAPSSVPAREEG
jgi:hypothetical protein